ncbi:YaiI/YqxD family protein [Hydrocarboniclastica marina]|uniref:UPF0178 protein soil367_12345 n=1 Tax=Hydrocarboniclastica marina TaxID=2259620 RepID=A0A4P7XL35_9ALTE|nr:YaiI/YqxD family protein [Hydrocarboniclastica marina]MAL97563.1 DUF188 domain-containing protein [Alteromonadaceae bacterium]QCF26657.1 YaiI/YqxD family protein [Hydrocarboniclastica marina]|tara:strand:- start:515 stop:964 length:450 start_codon:yes stop_codon:yes gene_type:complete
MPIWVDADACPRPIKDIIFKAANRAQEMTTFVANHALSIPPSPYLSFRLVPSGFDVADNHIVEAINAGDLVVTQDIPLAALAVEREAMALNPRGQEYTPESIRQRLAMRNLMEELRSTGIQTGGPDSFSNADRKRFADALDRWLRQRRV